MANQGIGKIHRAFGDATLAHDLPDQDKTRNGQERERIHSDHQPLGDDFQGHVPGDTGIGGGNPKGEI